MAGCNNSKKQRLFWQKNKKQLQSLIYGLGDEVPSEQTIRRVVALVKADETVKFLSEYEALKMVMTQERTVAMMWYHCSHPPTV